MLDLLIVKEKELVKNYIDRALFRLHENTKLMCMSEDPYNKKEAVEKYDTEKDNVSKFYEATLFRDNRTLATLIVSNKIAHISSICLFHEDEINYKYLSTLVSELNSFIYEYFSVESIDEYIDKVKNISIELSEYLNNRNIAEIKKCRLQLKNVEKEVLKLIGGDTENYSSTL